MNLHGQFLPDDLPNLPDGEYMSTRRIPLLVAGLALSSFAFGASGPQSFLDGNPRIKAESNIYPVRILYIDGVAPLHSPAPVTPGPHWIEYQLASEGLNETRKAQTVVIKIQPCTYYYIGARKDPSLALRWKLAVDEEDTIMSCNPAEEIKKAQAEQQKLVAPKAKPPGK